MTKESDMNDSTLFLISLWL